VPKDVVTASSPLQSTEAPRDLRRLGKWKAEEDAKLTDAVKKRGKDWARVAALVPGRTNTQCRQRWVEGLDLEISGKWVVEEDAKLTGAVKEHGVNNWTAVAALVPGRTKKQCRHRWIETLDPNVNTGKWTAEEDAKLTDAVKKHGDDWVVVATLVPGRKKVQCRVRWLHVAPTMKSEYPRTGRRDPPRKSQKQWTAEEDAKLISAVKKCGKDWVEVAALVPGRSNRLCRKRWVNCLDPGIDRAMGKWTAAEDAKLIDAVTKYGKDWVAVAALVPGRANMQCRARWHDSLDPGVERAMGKWTAEEDAKLVDAVKKHGNKWVPIAAIIPGRTNMQCCKRWVRTVDPSIERKIGVGKWISEEDAKLIDAVKKHGNNWVTVATLVPLRTKVQCRDRWVYVAPFMKGKYARTGVGEGVAAHTTDALATASPNDLVDFAPAPKDVVPVSAPLQSTEAPQIHVSKFRFWTAEEDAS
jgi:hypothetical protein